MDCIYVMGVIIWHWRGISKGEFFLAWRGSMHDIFVFFEIFMVEYIGNYGYILR